MLSRGFCILVLIAILPNLTFPQKNHELWLATKQAIPEAATYTVRMLQTAPPRLAVTATLAINGKALEMATTRPADIPEVGDRGWPALVRNLKVSDATGRSVALKSAGTRGWELQQPHTGRLTLDYEVDYSLLASNGWPAPREAAFGDPTHFTFVGRSLFITTREVDSSIVTFVLPRSWQHVTPWRPTAKSQNTLSVGAAKDLTENLIVLSRSDPDAVTAGGFRVFVTPLGHWQGARPEVKQVLRGVLPQLVRLIGFEGRERYSIVLLPTLETAGESYRQSFAYTFEAAPTRGNRALWGRLIAHEVFHYWNGWRLHGADYVSSQWFQEGFTEYAANLAMVTSGVVTPEDFRQQLSKHISNYRRLTTPLNAPGSRKGPPLYSGGALVAFCWDVQIRQASGGKRNLGDFFRTLWRQTSDGQRPFEWQDIRVALNTVAPGDWDGFFNAHIKGTEPLPLGRILSHVGMRLAKNADGSPRVELDPAAPASAKSLGAHLPAEYDFEI